MHFIYLFVACIKLKLKCRRPHDRNDTQTDRRTEQTRDDQRQPDVCCSCSADDSRRRYTSTVNTSHTQFECGKVWLSVGLQCSLFPIKSLIRHRNNLYARPGLHSVKGGGSCKANEIKAHSFIILRLVDEARTCGTDPSLHVAHYKFSKWNWNQIKDMPERQFHIHTRPVTQTQTHTHRTHFCRRTKATTIQCN